jgi:hypothetical protein
MHLLFLKICMKSIVLKLEYEKKINVPLLVHLKIKKGN